MNISNNTFNEAKNIPNSCNTCSLTFVGYVCEVVLCFLISLCFFCLSQLFIFSLCSRIRADMKRHNRTHVHTHTHTMDAYTDNGAYIIN